MTYVFKKSIQNQFYHQKGDEQLNKTGAVSRSLPMKNPKR
jgi:hypothetical protein